MPRSPASKATRVLIVDDHQLFRAGLCRLLQAEDDVEVVGQTGSGLEAVQLCEALKPDVIVLDYGLPDMDGLETTVRIAKLELKTRILILTMHASEEYAIRLIRSGASGFIVKGDSPDELLTALRKVARGGQHISASIMERMIGHIGKPVGEAPESVLSNREMQVMVLLAGGATTREVAEGLTLSLSTIETYRGRILEKLSLRNNSDITRFAIRRGLIGVD